MVSKRRTRRKRGGSGGDKTTHVQGHKSSPLAPVGNVIRMMSDTVGGLIKGTGDGIASAMGSSDPKGGDKTSSSDIPQPPTIDASKVPDDSKTSDSSHKGGRRTKKRNKHTKSKRRKRLKKHKKPKGASAPDITPISREWEVKNDPVQINQFANDPTIPDREKFDKLVNEMRNSGLTDGYFVIDYNSSRSPGHYGRYLISFSEDRDDNLLPDATIYTGGYADNISAYELEQLRRENRRRQREAEAEAERRRLEELERQRELEREMAEAEAMDLTLRELRNVRRMERIAKEEERQREQERLRELRNMRRMERIAKEEERQREQERILRKEYFENLPENKDVIVIEDPDGDINLGIRSAKPLTPQNEIPVTRPSFFQRMRSTINTLRRNRRNRLRRRATTVRPTGMGNKKKKTRHHKRRKHKKKGTKKKRKKAKKK